MPARKKLWTLLAATVLAVAGCGDDDGPVPVEGLVTLHGQPVEGATVSFVPDGGDGRPAGGKTDAEGAFELTTLEAGDGAVPGEYRIVVTKIEVAELPAFTSEGEEKDERLEKQFEAYLQSRRTARRTLLPKLYARAETTPLRCRVPVENPVVLNLSSSGNP